VLQQKIGTGVLACLRDVKRHENNDYGYYVVYAIRSHVKNNEGIS